MPLSQPLVRHRLALASLLAQMLELRKAMLDPEECHQELLICPADRWIHGQERLGGSLQDQVGL